MEELFEISNLKSAYKDDRSKVVLHIEKLTIPKGKIIFFVGPSGIGKSTILETLGIMNNTILSVDRFMYNGEDISGVWTWEDNKVSEFRNKEFSFIFQQNNLMPNFSAYENVMSTALIQGMSSREASRQAQSVLKQMDLPYQDDRPVFQYSGGQQQRLAFARAILPNFNVLFGDEPTGNLDPGSANNLANVLIDLIRQRNATAIIVSHDIALATNYADMIVRILPRDEMVDGKVHRYGVINEESLYLRDGDMWSGAFGNYSLTEMKEHLDEKLFKVNV